MAEAIRGGVFTKNETEHAIERPGTEQRIRAKTAWNADTLRGDYADVLILDEWQLMDEDAWETVGAPMMLDHHGDSVFIYTPPSLHSRSVSKARDPQHAARMFKRAQADTTGRWATFEFTSHDNPYLSQEALADITRDMTSLAYRQEIMAEDIDEAPGALWTRAGIERNRVVKAPELARVVVGVDPSATSGGDEAGIVTGGRAGDDYYTLADDSLQGSPLQWATAAVTAYYRHKADRIVAEANNGGEMVAQVIKQVDATVPVKLVHASRGKSTRAEPVAAIAEQGHDHHVGTFPALEDELCLWVQGDASPNRLDAKVWMMTELMARGELRKAASFRG
jgi:phage terminase large subunit-like protein